MLLTEEETGNVRKILEAPSLIKTPPPFTFRPQAWKKWKRRFSRYIINLEKVIPTQLEEVQLVHLLIYLLGDRVSVEETFKIIERFGWNPEMNLKDTLNLLGTHFRKSSINQIYLRVNFHRRMQMPGEPLIDFVNAAKFLATPCKFEDYEIFMRDKMIIGIHSEVARQKMFSYDDMLTFEMAFKIAFHYELRTGRLHG